MNRGSPETECLLRGKPLKAASRIVVALIVLLEQRDEERDAVLLHGVAATTTGKSQ